MFQNIAFVGGIHGSGKSSICIPASQKLDFLYLSASDVLNWAKVSANPKSKKVQDINFTQDRLIEGLKSRIQKDKIYLLDGHFCLFDGNGNIAKVPLSTFEEMKPAILFVVIDDPKKIASRLGNRDGILHDIAKLSRMQEQEIEYAQEISKLLNIPFYQIDKESIVIFENLLINFKKAYENIA